MNKFLCALLLFPELILSGREIPVSALILKNGATIKKDVLVLDGKKAYAQIPGTEKFNLTSSGMTLALCVKLADTRSKGPAETLDTFFSKNGTPFLFARYGHRLAANLRSNKNKITIKARGEKIPEQNKWYHAAFTCEYFDDTVQGETGYITTLYLNGEILDQTKHAFFVPGENTGCLELGKGYSSPWFFKGEIADIFAASKALSPGEIGRLFQKSRGGKSLKKRSLPSLSQGTKKLSFKEGELYLRTRGKGSPIAGLFDRKSKRSLLNKKMFSWQIRGNKKGNGISFASENIPFTVKNISDKGFTAIWKNTKHAAFEVISRFTLLDDGLTADLEIQNHSQDFVIKEVIYPEIRIPLFRGRDILFYPYMCGAEIPAPSRNRFRYGQSYTYPSANLSMQYSAYYAGGRGVFLGWQDPEGTIKDFSATGKTDAVDMTWRLPAAIPLDRLSGGNDFKSPGRIAFRLFSGGWYEAAMLHKEWALSHARWGKISLPRTDTPDWFRQIPCAVAPNGQDETAAAEGVDQLLFLQKYLELPVYALWFNWYDPGKRGWPAFPPHPYTRKLFKRIMDAGCRIEPYTDGRLWDLNDIYWENRGRPGAVKKEDGSIYTERHGKGIYGVMCPAVESWQNELLKLSCQVADISSAVYHDQVSAARGGLCFDKTHGHALNDPAVWLRGYRQIYRKIQAALPRHPQVSEDASEPYLDLFDGGHVWRFGFQGAVPAFQAVYGGRTQYLALLYDKIQKGDFESNFAKMAYSLVNGIKIGRMEIQELFHADEKRLFFKKTSHLYAAVCHYFNNGNMLAPLKFSCPVKTQSLMWSGHWRRNEKVTTPVIESRGYRWGEKFLYLFVNPTKSEQSCSPQIPGYWLCREGAGKITKYNNSITLAPRSCAVVVSDKTDALHIQKVLDKTAAFDAGVSYDTRIKFPTTPPLVLKKGELAGPEKTAGYFAASRAGKNGRFFGNIKMWSLISWGTVDFGSQKVDTLYLHAAVDKRFAGSTITILTLNGKGEKIPIGTHTMQDTGGWMKFQKIPVKLNRSLTGKAAIMLTFNNNGSCNLLGWEY